ncbi:MAG: hypothetical protein IT289_10360 [Oligoflexia bacterium]|nr:hypothetical protein [Oligoflexia bacterium]
MSLGVFDLSYSQDGEFITDVHLHRGKNIRPIWKKIEMLAPDAMIVWVDRFDSLCPIASEWALAQALEQSAQIECGTETLFERTLLNEVNRLVWLTTYLGKIFQALAQYQCFERILSLREQVFNFQDEVCGGRILPQALCVGGLRRPIAMGDVQKLGFFLKNWSAAWSDLKPLVEDPLLRSRLKGVAVVPSEEVNNHGLWGIIGKASGVSYDARRHRPHGAYALVDFNIQVFRSGDSLARFEVAREEIGLSIQILHQLMKLFPKASKVERPRPTIQLNKGFYFGEVESAKGPVISVLEVLDGGSIGAVKIITTGSRLLEQIPRLLRGTRVEDLELALASLGLDMEEAEL